VGNALGRGVALFLALLAPPAFADVVSVQPDAVSVTVYRGDAASAADLRDRGDSDTSGLAMITETRTVDLPAGRSRIRFEGVADAIVPASAAVEGLPGKLVERDFDYDLLDPGALIAASVGAQVTVRRTNPKTGQVIEEPATLLEGPDGVMVKTAEGVSALGCGAGPEALVFNHLPPGLSDRPTLSVLVDTPVAGRYQVKLSYLTVRIDWSADYVARLAPDGRTLDLTGWLTLSNRSGSSFAQAPTSVVAGDLARLPPDLPNIAPREVSHECWPMGTTSDIRPIRRSRPVTINRPEGETVTELVVVAEKRQMSVEDVAVRATESQLGDYKLYTLAEPTDLAPRQTKQVRFLHQARVRFEKLYICDVSTDFSAEPDPVVAATAVLSFVNKPGNGLGLAIPAGFVSIRQPQAGRDQYLFEWGVHDTPVGAPFELRAGPASDITVQRRIVSQDTIGTGDNQRARVAQAFTLTNAKPTPVSFEVRQQTDRDGFRVITESKRHALKNGAAVWRVTLPANGTATVSYTVEVAD
jgi:hypothetical protein